MMSPLPILLIFVSIKLSAECNVELEQIIVSSMGVTSETVAVKFYYSW